MLEEQATVVAVEPEGRVWVNTVRHSACGNCHSGAACGTSSLLPEQQMGAPLAVNPNGLTLAEGDRVLLGIPEGTILRGLFLLYVIPLLFMSGGGMAGQGLAGEYGAVAGAAAGLVAGLLAARQWTSQQQPDKYLPIVIKRIAS
ncbi:MAG TPA: SoxR reducing system RseC family protein [Fluviicoccus sp.]|nr:SoxR reducing system RseC family protein [Fluviicoccus sp.]